ITSAGRLEIGKSSLILANVFITNIDHDYTALGEHVVKQRIHVKDTVIGENCFIGMGAAIMAGTGRGKHGAVCANPVRRGIYPHYTVLACAPRTSVRRQNPATRIGEKK